MRWKHQTQLVVQLLSMCHIAILLNTNMKPHLPISTKLQSKLYNDKLMLTTKSNLAKLKDTTRMSYTLDLLSITCKASDQQLPHECQWIAATTSPVLTTLCMRLHQNLHNNTLMVTIVSASKTKWSMTRMGQSQPHEYQSQSIRPSPSSWITATSCQYSPLTSSAPNRGCRVST